MSEFIWFLACFEFYIGYDKIIDYCTRILPFIKYFNIPFMKCYIFYSKWNTIYTKIKLKYNIYCWYKSKKYQWNLRIWLNKLNNKHLDLNHGTYPLRLDLNEKRYWSSTFLLSKHLRALDAFYSVQNYILFTEIAFKNLIMLSTVAAKKFARNVCNCKCWFQQCSTLQLRSVIFCVLKVLRNLNECPKNYLSYWNNICYLIWTSKGRYTQRILNGKLYRFSTTQTKGRRKGWDDEKKSDVSDNDEKCVWRTGNGMKTLR